MCCRLALTHRRRLPSVAALLLPPFADQRWNKAVPPFSLCNFYTDGKSKYWFKIPALKMGIGLFICNSPNHNAIQTYIHLGNWFVVLMLETHVFLGTKLSSLYGCFFCNSTPLFSMWKHHLQFKTFNSIRSHVLNSHSFIHFILSEIFNILWEIFLI